MKTVSVVEYDPNWPRIFDSLHVDLSAALGDTALAIEHVGSTSVTGLSAKAIIDIDVVVDGPAGVSAAIERLADIGYRHRGDLGIKGREAFANPNHTPRHHLYVCPRGNLAHRNHMTIRDALRSNSELADEYGALKIALAARFFDDMASYVAGKSEFLLAVLKRGGFQPEDLDSIRQANRPTR